MNNGYFEVLDKEERDPTKLFLDVLMPRDIIKKDKVTEKIGTGVDTIKIIKNFMPQKDIDFIMPQALSLYQGKPSSIEHKLEVEKLILKYREKMKYFAEQLFELELEHDEYASPFTEEMFLAARKPNFITDIHCDYLDPDNKYYDFAWSGHISNLIYLNNNYEGGELYFLEHNLKIKPEPGMLVSFPGNFWNRHGIFPADNYRFSISIFFKIKNFN